MRRLAILTAIPALLLVPGCDGEAPTEPADGTPAASTSASSTSSTGSPGSLYAKQGSDLIEINTSTGLGSDVGPLGADYGPVGLATARAPVPLPVGMAPPGTLFGVLKAPDGSEDVVVVIDTKTGGATEIVSTSDRIGARGAAFGPDGRTLYVQQERGRLFPVDTETGEVGAVEVNVPEAIRTSALEFDPERELFLTQRRTHGEIDELVAIDLDDDPAWSVVDTLGTNICTLARSPDGDWFTQDGGVLHTVDVTSAELTAVEGSEGVGTCGSEFAPERRIFSDVRVDVKPNSDPSSWNCANDRAPVPVAVLSDERFDATRLDANSVRFGKEGHGAGEVHRTRDGDARRHVKDVDGDGMDDMVFHFPYGDTGFGCDDIPEGERSATRQGRLTGETMDEELVLGTGEIRLVAGGDGSPVERPTPRGGRSGLR